MNEIQRYDGVVYMNQHQDGEYVLYSDHIKAVREAVEIIKGLMEQIDDTTAPANEYIPQKYQTEYSRKVFNILNGNPWVKKAKQLLGTTNE